MSSALRVAPTRSRIPLLVFGLTVAISAATAWPAAAKEETGEPVEFDRQVRFVSTSTVNDALTGDIDGRLYAESRGTRVLAAQRKGYSIDTLEAADFGGGKLLVAGWVSGGKARYLIPEVFKVVESGGAGTRLVKVWGPFEENPLYEGDMRIEEKAGKSRLIVEDSLVYHNFVAPHLRRTTIWSWKGDSLEAGESTYGEPTSAYQKSNLAYEFYTRGNHKKSLRLYLEAIQESEKTIAREDPELAAALYFAAASNFEKLGETREQRAFLAKVADLFPDTSYARKAADKLLRLKAVELKGR